MNSMNTKDKYGEVESPAYLVETMLGFLPDGFWENKNIKILDVGTGKGIFCRAITSKLKEHGHSNINLCLEGVEIQSENVAISRLDPKNEAMIHNEDFLKWNITTKYDLIIGNPPFNSNGQKIVPTNTDKTLNRAKTIWTDFVFKSLSMLNENGKLLFITPSIWLKPDKAGVYSRLTSQYSLKIRSFDASQTSRIFKGQAQTPTSIFLAYKNHTPSISLYDTHSKSFHNYTKLHLCSPLPTKHIPLINKLQSLVRKYGNVKVVKTSNTPSLTGCVTTQDTNHPFPNIKTAHLEGKDSKLIVEWSATKNKYHGKSKLVLPHKMYGFPFLDRTGIYGIARRDLYVIVSSDIDYLEKCRQLLANSLALKVFDASRYRMRFLEKYAFEFIPNPCDEILSIIEEEKSDTGYTFSYTKKIDESKIHSGQNHASPNEI